MSIEENFAGKFIKPVRSKQAKSNKELGNARLAKIYSLCPVYIVNCK